MKKIIFILCLSVIGCLTIKAQTFHLSLEESIEIAKSQSYEIQTLLQEKIIAENELKVATAFLRTSVSMNFTLPQYTETIREWQDSTGISFFPIKTLRGIGNLNFRQPLPTDGTIFVTTGLSTINDYYFDRRATTFSTRIGLIQPVNSFWGYNSIKSDLKSARLRYERSNKALKRAELDLVYEVSASYYALLLQQKRVEIAQMNLERKTEANEIAKNKYEAGLIREVESLQTEVDLVEAQDSYYKTVFSLKSSTNSFKQLIGLELNATVTLKGEMNDYTMVVVDVDKAVEMAIANRLEIRDRDIQIELQQLLISRLKAQGLPQASLEASWEKMGVSSLYISESLPTSISSSWDNLQNRPAQYQVGLTLTIPIIDWGRNRASVRAAEARQRQNYLSKENEERGIEVEVRNLVANIQTTLTRLKLLERNVSVAERSYSITLKRFTDGDIDSQALALESTRLNSAQSIHLDAFVAYQLLLSDLARKTFYDFENDNPIE